MHRVYRVGSKRLKIFLGDITDLEVDAIVNSENSDLRMDHIDGASVSAAIRRRAQEGYAERVAERGPIELGQAVATPAEGNFRCKTIIHAAVVRRLDGDRHETDRKALRASVASSLEVANALGLRSIGFPAFGVRAAQVPKEVSSDIMIEEAIRVLHARTSLEEIVFALLDPESFLVFFERAITRNMEFTAPIDLAASEREGGIELRLSEGGPAAVSETAALDRALLGEIGSRFNALQSAARRRLVDAPVMLRSLGAFLWNFFLPPVVRERLAGARGANLTLRLDTSLRGVPLELAWDGQDFLCERFRIGRQVSVPGRTARASSRPRGDGRVIIFCNPQGGLAGARREGLALFRLLTERGLDVELRGGERARRSALLALLSDAAVLHWCGHATTVEGLGQAWELADGRLSPADLEGLAAPPALVFANACARDDSFLGPERLAMGSAFVERGVRHYIGSLWEIDDQASRRFAEAFYRDLVEGRDTGDALRAARAEVKSKSAGAIDWAAFVHYGDPRESPLPEREKRWS